MKRFIVIFTLFIISLMTPCENLNGTTKVVPTEMADKYKVYCEITYMPYQRVAIVNIGSTIDAIRDKDGKPKEFISIMEAINYMAKFGWEITEIYGIPNGTDKNTYYFLCKEVSNESEINKGLNLNPLDKTFINQSR